MYFQCNKKLLKVVKKCRKSQQKSCLDTGIELLPVNLLKNLKKAKNILSGFGTRTLVLKFIKKLKKAKKNLVWTRTLDLKFIKKFRKSQ